MTSNPDRERSSLILDRCIALPSEEDEPSKTRQKRLLELIGNFETWHVPPNRPLEHVAGWHFCVSAAFRAALDIKLTARTDDGNSTMEWTQGSWFHFQEGDTIYDSPNAYLPWDLNNINMCLDIRHASPAQPPNKNVRAERDPGAIIFDVLTPNRDRTKLIDRGRKTLTQDEFVRLLISGPPANWLKESE